MLIYVDKPAAELLLQVLNYHKSKTADDKSKLIYSDLIQSITEGLKDYYGS